MKFIWLLLLPLLWIIYWGISHEQIGEAYSKYVQGVQAKTIAERKEAFNQSLAIYRDLERDYSPTFGNGKLYFNIANDYFQLEQYPLAIYYYELAKALRPSDPNVSENLKIAQGKLGIEPSDEKKYISLPTLLQIFFGLSLGALLFASLQIWLPSILFQRMTWLFALLAAFILLNLAYIQFLTPKEGVLIHGTSLHRGAGDQYALVLEKPLPSGIKVDVLDAQGPWLKIETPEEDLGFIPKDAILVID